MQRPWIEKVCLFAMFAVVMTILSSPETCRGAEADQSLNVVKDNEKTVHIIGGARKEDSQDAAKAWEMLKNLRIDRWRGEDGKGPDSDRRGRGEHP
jgi:hypothetical protein